MYTLLSVDGVWEAWGAWSACSQTCGGGFQVRRRKCGFPVHASQGDWCPGRGTGTQTCNPQNCTTTYVITLWRCNFDFVYFKTCDHFDCLCVYVIAFGILGTSHSVELLYYDRNYSDLENLLYFISSRKSIPKDVKLYVNENVLSESAIYKTISLL